MMIVKSFELHLSGPICGCDVAARLGWRTEIKNGESFLVLLCRICDTKHYCRADLTIFVPHNQAPNNNNVIKFPTKK